MCALAVNCVFVQAMWVWTDFAIPIVNAVLVWRLIVHYMVLSQTKMRLW